MEPVEAQVLNVKYRPRTFSEVVGQPRIEILKSYVKSRRAVPGLWIFFGPKGTGKTSTARVFAMALNCLDLKEGKNPCGMCDNCKDIVGGIEDILKEIDGATYRGIEEIRNLKRIVAFKARGYRVIVIDEAHQLTTPANNAMLKIVEEPPKGVIFVLVTTQIKKILNTIQDRAIMVKFERVSDTYLHNHLHKLAEVEGVDSELTSEDVDTLIRESDGSVRSLVKGLDQFISLFREGNKDEFHRIFISDREEEEKAKVLLIRSYCNKQIDTFYEAVESLRNYGYSPVDILIHLYSGVLTISLRPHGLTKFKFSDDLAGIEFSMDQRRWFLDKIPTWLILLKEFSDYELLKKFLLEFLLT